MCDNFLATISVLRKVPTSLIVVHRCLERQLSHQDNLLVLPRSLHTNQHQAGNAPLNQSTIESINSGAECWKTAAHLLTTDDLPTSIKEVFNNLRQPRDELDSSEESHDGERPATRQARQDQGSEQDSPPGNNARTSSRNAASTRQRRANSTTRHPTGT